MARPGTVFVTILALVFAAAAPARAHDVWIFVGGGGGHFFRHEHRIGGSSGVTVIPGQVFVVPPSYHRCFIPGYWTHQWIPQVYSYNVWVPGQWSPEGTWIAGHYAPQVQSTGSWHPVWVPDRHAC